MIHVNIAGLKISFEFGFFAVAAVFCLLDAPELALTAVCACVIHEIGHCIATVISDIKIEQLVFWAGGVKMISSSSLKPVYSEVFVLFAGPFFNFAAALFFYLTGADWAFSVNLILGLFNLLPFSNLDGGAVLRKILEHYELNSSLIMKAVAIISAAIIIAFFYIFNTGNITGYITVILLTVYEFCY